MRNAVPDRILYQRLQKQRRNRGVADLRRNLDFQSEPAAEADPLDGEIVALATGPLRLWRSDDRRRSLRGL